MAFTVAVKIPVWRHLLFDLNANNFLRVIPRTVTDLKSSCDGEEYDKYKLEIKPLLMTYLFVATIAVGINCRFGIQKIKKHNFIINS